MPAGAAAITALVAADDSPRLTAASAAAMLLTTTSTAHRFLAAGILDPVLRLGVAVIATDCPTLMGPRMGAGAHGTTAPPMVGPAFVREAAFCQHNADTSNDDITDSNAWRRHADQLRGREADGGEVREGVVGHGRRLSSVRVAGCCIRGARSTGMCGAAARSPSARAGGGVPHPSCSPCRPCWV